MHKILYKLSYLWYNPAVEVRDTGKSKTERARELRKGIDEYFDERTARGRFPTEAGMLLALGLSEERYAALRRERIFAREFERARLARMDWLENQMVTEGGKASGCMNALKQEKNGWVYSDRAAAGSREQKLVIELKGVGSGAAL